MRDIRAELRKEHLNRKDARARLEALRLEAQAKVRGLSVQRIVWEETREVREAERAAHAARLRLKRTLTRERHAFKVAYARSLAANGFSTTEIAAEIGASRHWVSANVRVPTQDAVFWGAPCDPREPLGGGGGL
jgi:hypothetical protein